MQEKRGEVPDAFTHPELGPIAFIYGDESMGLRHIEAKRGIQWVRRIPAILRNGRLERDPKLPRAYLIQDGDPADVAVIRLDWDGEQKTWLVTAHPDDKGKWSGVGKTSRTADNESGLVQGNPSQSSPQGDSATTSKAEQPITSADVQAAQQQAAAIIGARIDAMSAGDVNKIAKKFLPTMGMKPTMSKANNKAAMTDSKINLEAAATEVGAVLPAEVTRALQADMEGRVADVAQDDGVTKEMGQAPAEPNPLEHTPKQYADAWLRWSAETNALPLAEVREMQGDEAGLKAIEQRWVDAVLQETKSGQPLPAKTLDKLLEVRPNTQLPESAIPDGYQRPKARKAEKEEAAARKAKPPAQSQQAQGGNGAMFSRRVGKHGADTPANALRTKAATIRSAITKAYGKLLGQLESKCLVTLTQTMDQAIEMAAQARAAKTGQPVERVRATLRASVKNSVGDQTQTEAFKRWFGDSKVVDAEGKPLVVYHGTSADFSVFDTAQSRDIGLHFGTQEQASRFGNTMMPVYLSLQNPLRVEDSFSRINGHGRFLEEIYYEVEMTSREYDRLLAMARGARAVGR